ncbi:hypothetical protein [[Haemophilus] ducreyi]|uniref:hypothetical protein n=1 Tax=Haemophilus ducreyi TaxID=730 RepID=UPI000AA8CFA9|nr:hypothetical protein [[Haemophilus] ducreyi]
MSIKAGNVTKEALPDDIKAGDRIALAHQNVSDVKIAELKENTDFVVDAIFGTKQVM